MESFLYYAVLDNDLFPELEREPGEYAIEAALLSPQTEPRVPAPKESPLVLLASYTLLASMVPAGSTLQIEITGPRPGGKSQQARLVLLEPPPQRDNVRPIAPRTPVEPGPGTVYRRVFWVDLGPLLRDGTLMPGDRLALSYGSASTALQVPAGAGRR